MEAAPWRMAVVLWQVSLQPPSRVAAGNLHLNQHHASTCALT